MDVSWSAIVESNTMDERLSLSAARSSNLGSYWVRDP
jgi:hypothetical protein